jgi:alkanesulfonate monooxygenase SsuD/methylene tetrahydromethanopterin reductase-like flavin-dependent oxidoreductase (luciferase family)
VVRIRFGIFYEHQLPKPWQPGDERRLYKDALEQIEIADRVGFDYAWEVEHHFLEEYSHSAAPEIFLAAASQRTTTIRLGHGIVQIPPPVNHPARVAERIATLDLISDGRVDFGTGEASSAAELSGFGVPRGEKRAMWQDAIDAITRMFVEEPFAGWHSPYLRMPPRNVIPKTVQKPHPPLWVACSRRETIHLAARNGIGALSFSFVTPQEAARWSGEYYALLASEECLPAGFAVNPNLAVVLPMMCHEDLETARERGVQGANFFGYALAHYYGPSKHSPGHGDIWSSFTRRSTEATSPLATGIGTPEQLIELVRSYQDAGVDQMIFVLQSGKNRHEDICESLELFGKRVIPVFAEGREERERAKAERLAPAIEAALARRAPARQMPEGYQIAEEAELARIVRREMPPPRVLLSSAVAGTRRLVRRRGQDLLARMVGDRSDAELERRLGPRGQRVLFAAMAGAFDPAKAFGFQGAIEFRLTGSDPAPTPWTIMIRGDRAFARRISVADPAVVLTLSGADLLRLIAGTADPVGLLTAGRIHLAGDPALVSRLGEMFGGPSPY